MNADLQKIHGGCYVDEDEHWLWRGAVSDNNWPRVYSPNHSKPKSPKEVQTGRRAVWHAKHGKAIPNGWRVYGTCGKDKCISPEHMRCGPTSEWGAFTTALGTQKGNLRRIAANRAIGRKRSKMTKEIVDAVASSDARGIDLANDLGISDALVSGIRNGKAGLCWQPVGGVFAGLLRPMNESQSKGDI